MNYKIFVGAILAGVVGVAAAQSQVSIYGILDAGLAYGSGGPGGSAIDVASGMSAVSRLGFKGSENLGGGWSARFVLESALALDTGATDKDNLLFGREAWVSLASEQLGAIAVGRQYTPGYRTLRAADPFANNYGGAADRLMKAEVGGVRTPNTITYTTPALGAMDVQLSYAAGEVAGDSRKARQLGASIGYQAGKLSMRIAHQQANNATATDGADSTLYTLKYDFGPAIASVGYGTNHGLQDARDHDLLTGLTIPVERHKLMLSYIRKEDDARTTNFSASQVALPTIIFCRSTPWCMRHMPGSAILTSRPQSSAMARASLTSACVNRSDQSAPSRPRCRFDLCRFATSYRASIASIRKCSWTRGWPGGTITRTKLTALSKGIRNQS